MFLAAKVKFCEQKLNNAENEEFRDKRRIPLPNRMIFWKNSKLHNGINNPPPLWHFSKNSSYLVEGSFPYTKISISKKI